MSRTLLGSIAGLMLAFIAGTPCSWSQEVKEKTWSPDLMLRVKQLPQVRAAPDGKRVAFVVRQAVMEGQKSVYVSQVHLANADGSGALQLTRGEKSCNDPQWSPDGKRIAFLSDRSGKRDLWVLRVEGGAAEKLTDVKTGVSSFQWSPDGEALAFVALDPPSAAEELAAIEKNDARVVDENVKMNRLYVVSSEKTGNNKSTPRRLTTGNYNVGSSLKLRGYDWSPDSKTIAFTRTRTPSPDDWTTADVFLVDVAKALVKPLVSTPAAEAFPLYSPDGRWIAYVASDSPPTWASNHTINVVPTSGGPPRPLADTFDKQPTPVGWSKDSQKIYYTEARGTLTELYALPLDGPPEEVGKGQRLLGGVTLNRGRTLIGFSMEAADKPPEAWVSSLERFEPVQISSVNKDVAELPLGRTEVLRWKSKDGLEIEGLLTYPVGYERGRRYPLLLCIHGGPAGVFTERFIGAFANLYPIAAFASKGYAVLRCNVRGSSGYGRKFRYANYGDWGGKDFQDLMAGVDHVIATGVADPDRLGVMGWSYGGFMTSWTVTQTKRFRAASVGAGVTNLMSFTGTADIPGFLPDYFGGEPWDKLDAYRAHSAMFNVKGVSTPTLIQHGEKDDRVPISQGYEFYNALKRQGCTVKMVVYPRTPHSPQEPKLLKDVMERNLLWFDKYVSEGKK